MGDAPNAPDDAVADLQGDDGAAVARGVMDDNATRTRHLREAVQQLDAPEGQPGDERVRDIARVIVAANAVVNGTAWDDSAKAAYGEWQAVEAAEVDGDALAAAAELVREAAATMLDAAGTQVTDDPTIKLGDWGDGQSHLDAVVERAKAGRARLGSPAG